MRPSNDQTRLIAALFAAATGDGPGWAGFLAVLAALVQADGAALAVGAGTVWRHGAPPLPGARVVEQMRMDRIYAQDSLSPPMPEGFLRAVKVRVGRESHALLLVHRGPHGRDFRSADALPLDGLAPFLGQAVEIWRGLERLRARNAWSERLARDLGAGWIVFDRAGVILDLSEGVAEWGRTTALRLTERRRLELDDPARAQQFRQGLAVCADGGSACVAVQDAPRVELRLSPGDWLGERAIHGFLRQAPSATRLPVDRVAAHLGLSRSEARLVALLCDGATLRDAARALNWTEETARSASKQVFARLGVRGQPGLLRRVLNGALWLG